MTIDIPDGYEELSYDDFLEEDEFFEEKDDIVDAVIAKVSAPVVEQPKPVVQSVSVNNSNDPIQRWRISGYTVTKYSK